ncbi:MAG: efflux RND transporter permease subunit [Myxococcota bacterium]
MNISEVAYRYRAVVYLAVAAAMIFGAVSYFTLPAQEYPILTIRRAVVVTNYPGLSAERTELLITKKLEQAIREVPEVEEITSVTTTGSSVIHIQTYFRFTDLDQIWDEVREKIEGVKSSLPEGTRDPVLNDNFGDVAILTAALTAPGFETREIADIASHLRDQLYGIPGTKKIELHGLEPERIYIEISNARLAELGMTPGALVGVLRGQNIIRPGGEIDAGRASFIVEPSGDFESLEDIRRTLIRVPGGNELFQLQDVAEVRRGVLDPPHRLAYFNGTPAVILSVAMLPGERALDYGARVKARLEALEQTLPVGFSLDLVTYQPEQVANAVYGVTENVLQTLAIVLAVVILFLGVRTGLIVGAIVPAVMLVTLAIMGAFDLALERMSLATLVIALGLLVDNGIVIAEDFKRRLEEGASRKAALRATGSELAFPLLSSSLTSVLVFLPLMLAEHGSGEYTRSISLLILITLLTSWVLAMTVTPLLCFRFVRVASAEAGPSLSDRVFARLAAAYAVVIRRSLRSRRLIVASTLVLLVGAGAAMTRVPQKFFPDSDRPQLLVYLDLPAGVTSRATDDAMKRLMAAMENDEQLEAIEHHAAYVGFGGPRFVLSLTPADPAPNRAFMVARVDDVAHLEATMVELRRLIAVTLPEARAEVTRMYLGPSDPGVVQVQVKGPDLDFVFDTGGQLEDMLLAIPGTVHVASNWENRTTKLDVVVDPARARRAGVSSAEVADAAAGFIGGRFVSEYRDGDDVIPIVMRAPASERNDLGRLEDLMIHPQGPGAPVPLGQVADVRLRTQYASIAREDLTRTLTVTARNVATTPEDLAPILAPQLDALRAKMPPGHTVEFDGIVKDSKIGKAALASNIPLCFGLMVLLLVTQFNSYRRPLIIFLTIPLVVIGAALGLHVMASPFGFMVILGLYALAGIIVNNAIVLIDRIDLERSDGGRGLDDAIVEASRLRLRPILMTTITTILGLMPLILVRDPLFYGMAVVMAFGLMVGTFLTLGVVPILYRIFFRRDAEPALEGQVAS